MQVQQGDILLRTTKAGSEQLWISQRLVVDKCEIGNLYLKDRARRLYKKSVRACDLAKSKEFLPDSGKAWRWGRNQNGYYYCYDNIPDRKPTFYRSKLGSEQELKEALNELKSGQKESLKEFAKVLFEQRKAKELSESLAWCRFMKQQVQDKLYGSFGIRNQSDFFSICCDILQSKNLEGLKVKSPAYLRNKISDFPTDTETQRTFLISKKYGNDNTRKIGKTLLVNEVTGEILKFDIHQALIYNCYMNPNSMVKEAMRQLYIKYYTPAIKEFGYEPVAYSTFTHHLSGNLSSSLKMDRERHGKDWYNKNVLAYVPSERLTQSHLLFAGDGSGTISYKYTNSQGKLKHMKLFVLMITDIASRKIVGWSVAPQGQHKESGSMVKAAVKMALKTCEYKTMYEFISDNHGAFSGDENNEFLNLVFNRVRRIKKGNSQANPAEMEFRLLKQYLRSYINFVSSSWNAGIERQSNADYQGFEHLPTYREAIVQFEQIVKDYNATATRSGAIPDEIFANNKYAGIKDIDDRIIRKIEGNHTKVNISYMRGFVKVSKTKGYEIRNDYLFEIPDYWETGAELISKANGYQRSDVQVVWNEDFADLYTLEGKYILTCPRASLSSQSYVIANEEHKAALKHHRARKEKAIEIADNFKNEIVEITNQLPYSQAIAFGGNKESFNEEMTAIESKQIINSSKKRKQKERVDREFDKYKDKIEAALMEEN